MDLSDFQAWQAAGPERDVSIKIHQNYSGENETIAWVYDSHLMVGQYVKDVSEIDLEGKVDAKERLEYDRLREKFGVAA